MTVEKKTIRSDIPGHNSYLNGSISYGGSPQDEFRRLIVGRDISLSGDIAACDHLVVEGVVQALTFSARRMDILEPGLFSGSCEVQDAVIAGRFEGQLTVPGRLIVKSTGRIHGEISCGILEVESGAKIEGRMSSLAFAETTGVDIPQPSEINDNMNNKSSQTETASGEQSPRVFRRAAGY